MSDRMRIQPFSTQLRRILAELDQHGSIFGTHRSLFWTPPADARFAVPRLFGKFLATPVGPSAGPHTQLSQNIVSSFLCGGRFIELKTVQVMDRLAIARPCIDMTDEGYNVEWSQELTLDESAHEYVVAWALVHLLPHALGWDAAVPAVTLPGVIFDMSVGYNLEGIRDARVTRFMDTLEDASEEIGQIEAAIARDAPQFCGIRIPRQVVNSVTLSTMHGCPPDEIERIARYMLEERGLHTVVKLNPTLLGRRTVLEILHAHLGFTEMDVPESVFEHDLQYDRALELIASLQGVAARCGLTFGVKLSNTLAMRNHAGRLPGDEMYMSGRALYPVTMALYERLVSAFDGRLHVSYSAGADADNVARILSCGALPVTGCTDLLKPGGVARLAQWLENIDAAMTEGGAGSLADWSRDRLENVGVAAADALDERRYRKEAFAHGLPKVGSGLGLWDCVAAPCVEACAVAQNVPEYAWLIAKGDYELALEAILARNPLPGVTGHVCTRVCETRCTRNDYDESVAIRALKRVAEELGQADYVRLKPDATPDTSDATSDRRDAAKGVRGIRLQPDSTGRRVAIIGSGPSGLAAAAFLALNGVAVTVFEARDVPGGMMRLVPPFRLPIEVIERDIARIVALGVEICLNTPVVRPPEDLLNEGFDAVYLASGFQRDAPLRIPGAVGPGVLPALQLLDRARRGERVDLGSRAVVVGGGDTAMDAVRTAHRFTGHPAAVIYRRTRREMPAAAEEVDGALEEGNDLEELVSPVEVVRTAGRVTGVRCVRNELGDPGPDGRRSPVPIPGSDFVIPCDAVVVAVGQLPELAFLDGSRVARHARGGVIVDGATGCAGPSGIYAGGDVVVEPGSIISACADGRRAAESICAHLGIRSAAPAWRPPVLSEEEIRSVKRVRARRVAPLEPASLPRGERLGFALIESSLTDEEARAEALRCVQCSTFCDKCLEVCPNRANYTFLIEPVSWRLPVLSEQTDGTRAWVTAGTELFQVSQTRQILHVDDFCNECDNCQTFCVHHGRPYLDKPRLFLDAAAFEAEESNAFHIDGATIRRREDGVESRLTIRENGMTYEAAGGRVELSPDWKVVGVAPAVRLRPAAEMLVIYRGVTSSLPFLLLL